MIKKLLVEPSYETNWDDQKYHNLSETTSKRNATVHFYNFLGQ